MLLNDKSVIDLVNNPDSQINSGTQSENFFNIKIVTVLILYIPIQMILFGSQNGRTMKVNHG